MNKYRLTYVNTENGFPAEVVADSWELDQGWFRFLRGGLVHFVVREFDVTSVEEVPQPEGQWLYHTPSVPRWTGVNTGTPAKFGHPQATEASRRISGVSIRASLVNGELLRVGDMLRVESVEHKFITNAVFKIEVPAVQLGGAA